MLISILVLSVGILAMAALIPVGAYELSEAAKMDATSTLGRAAFRDLEVRGYLSPWAWVANGQTCLNSDGTWNSSCGMTATSAFPFVIDPLMVSLNGTTLFPYQVTPFTTTATDWTYIPQQLLVQRATVLSSSGGSVMQSTTADRIFRAGDDLIFDPGNFDRKRPAMSYDRDASNNAMQARFTGNYTWFITLTPSYTEMNFPAMLTGANTLNASRTRQYAATVVVCYKRDLTVSTTSPMPAEPLPGERMLYVQNVPYATSQSRPDLKGFVGGGYAGGEVRLRTRRDYKSWLTLRPGQWMMLSGYDPSAASSQVFVNWYRVVAVDRDIQDDDTTSPKSSFRFVTLHGPDFPVATPYTFATVVEGVIGVYQKTITIDGDSPWSR